MEFAFYCLTLVIFVFAFDSKACIIYVFFDYVNFFHDFTSITSESQLPSRNIQGQGMEFSQNSMF